jgi:hypothetical protein
VSPTKRHGVAKPPYMLPGHTSLTDEQRSKVEEKVGAIQSETPKMDSTDSPSQKKSKNLMCIMYIKFQHFLVVFVYY